MQEVKKIRYNKFKLNTPDNLFIHPIGDTHIGHQNCDLDFIEKELSYIPNDPHHRILLMGDLIDCGIRTSIGASPYEQSLSPNQQLNTIKNLFEPFKEQIDGCVIGNHEYRIAKDSGIDVLEQFCDKLDIPYMLYSGIITYSIGTNGNERAYNIYMTHGNAGGGVGNALMKCKNLSNKVVADVYLNGHCHYNSNSERIMKYVDSRNGKIVEGIQKFVLTGHSLSYDESYADMANLEISPKGFPIIILKGSNKKDILIA